MAPSGIPKPSADGAWGTLHLLSKGGDRYGLPATTTLADLLRALSLPDELGSDTPLGAVEVAWINRPEGARVQVFAPVTLFSQGPHAQEVHFEADCASDGDRFALHAEADLTAPVPVGALLAEAATHIGEGFDLPDAIRDRVVSDAKVSVVYTHTSSAPDTDEVVARFACSLDRSGRAWEVIPGLLALALGRLSLSVTVNTFTGRAAVVVDAVAWVELLGAGWTVEVQAPSGLGLARLGPGPYTFAGLADHFGLHAPGNLAALALTAASIRFDGAGRSALAHVELGDVWHGEHFNLKQVRVDVGYQGGEGGGVSASLSADLDHDHLSMSLRATHAGPGLGWAFEGSLTQAVTLGGALSAFGVPDAEVSALGSLAGHDLLSLDLRYATHTGTMHLDCSAQLTASAKLVLSAEVTRGAGAARSYHFDGRVELGANRIALSLVRDGAGTLVVGSYDGSGSGGLTLSDLVTLLGGTNAESLPAVKLRRAVAAWDRGFGKDDAQPAGMFFAGDLDLAIGFTSFEKIPVLGERLPADLSFGVHLSPLYAKSLAANAGFGAQVSAHLPAGFSLPDPLADGLTTGCELRIGDERLRPPSLSSVSADTTSALTQTTPPAPSTTGSPPASPGAPSVTWITVDKTLGGLLTLRRLGVSLAGSSVSLRVDGSITIASLTLDPIGLALSYDLRTRTCSPRLDGLALSLAKGPLQITAAFMNEDGDFVGRALVATSKFSIAAIAGFSSVGGAPSLFVYGALNAPIGGPPFFFVEGLAAGFGFNRRLTLPTVDTVRTFPLIEDAGSSAPPAPGADLTADLGAQMQRLHESIAPARGESFFAAGVKFTSFRLLRGFALAVVTLDTLRDTWRMTLVGTADWCNPPEAAPPLAMAWVRVNVLATYSPADGALQIQAALTPDSYVQSPLCHVHGGIAASFWFNEDHAGDFVVSAGGYHPDFKVPAHYPVPPRLALEWRISDSIHVGGSLYFALTPQSLMFGFAFSAVCACGPLSAHFDAGLDFLMRFKPLHYDASGYIEIGASFHSFFGTISVSAGASLHIWGPAFSGTAHAHLGPFSATVSFGADAATPPHLPWSEFAAAFLPAKFEDKALSVVPTLGLVSALDMPAPPTVRSKVPTWWKINPKHLTLTVESLLPVTATTAPGVVAQPPPELGVRPMGDEATYQASLSVTVTRDGHDALADFSFAGVDKRFPAALWARSTATVSTVPALGVLTLTPAEPPAPDHSEKIPRAVLQYEVRGKDSGRAAGRGVFDDLSARSAAHRATDREELRRLLGDGALTATRTAFLKALGAPELDPRLATGWVGELADAMRDAPQIAGRATAR